MAKKKKTAKKSPKKTKNTKIKSPIDRTMSHADYLRVLIRLSERNIKENSDGTDLFAEQTARLKKELGAL